MLGRRAMVPEDQPQFRFLAQFTAETRLHVGRGLQGRGRGFEPRRPRHKSKGFMVDDSPKKAEVAGLIWVQYAPYPRN